MGIGMAFFQVDIQLVVRLVALTPPGVNGMHQDEERGEMRERFLIISFLCVMQVSFVTDLESENKNNEKSLVICIRIILIISELVYIWSFFPGNVNSTFD